MTIARAILLGLCICACAFTTGMLLCFVLSEVAMYRFAGWRGVGIVERDWWVLVLAPWAVSLVGLFLLRRRD